MAILASMGLRGRSHLSDASYRELFERIDEGFFVGELIRDPTGKAVDFRFLEINDAFVSQTGLAPKSVLGLRVTEAMRGFSPEVIETYSKVVDSGEPATLEMEAPSLGNRWYRTRAYRVDHLRFMVLFSDISERKRTEEALKESEALLADIVETVDQLIWSTRPDGYLDFFNRRWYEFTGTTPGEGQGADWVDLLHPNDRERTAERWKHSLTTGESYQIEYRLWHHSKGYRWVLGRAHPVRNQAGELIRWMGTCTDIHEQKELAEELELASNELSHRIKNIFAVISALITLSVREFPEAGPFAQELRERIEALGKAHDYARPHGKGSAPGVGSATILGLIRQLLQPYQIEGRDKILVEGDDGPLEHHASTPVSLAVHELATNADGPELFGKCRSGVGVHERVITLVSRAVRHDQRCGSCRH